MRSKFIIYTSPTTGKLFDALVHSGRYEEYERWLRLLVSTFGEVIDLMGHNSFTDNAENYYDYHHFSAEGGRWLVRHAIDVPIPAVGNRITRENLESVIAERRTEAAAILARRPNPCAEFGRR